MLLTLEDRHLVDQQLELIRGWLTQEAGYLSCILLNLQQQEGIRGPLFEIGVFEGKYLALLYHAARVASQRVVGIDIFEFSSAQTVASNLEKLFGELALLKAAPDGLEGAQPGRGTGAPGRRAPPVHQRRWRSQCPGGAQRSQALQRDPA